MYAHTLLELLADSVEDGPSNLHYATLNRFVALLRVLVSTRIRPEGDLLDWFDYALDEDVVLGLERCDDGLRAYATCKGKRVWSSAVVRQTVLLVVVPTDASVPA